jgi:FKBP-type peptidyl-prolyl cis-trans isomerase
MKRFAAVFCAIAASILIACQQGTPRDGVGAKGNAKGSPAGVTDLPGAAAKPKAPTQPAPADLKAPPADAKKTASGLIYKITTPVLDGTGITAGANDTVMLQYTGWKQSSGDTMFSTRTRGQPAPMTVASAAPGLAEALQLLKKGERATVWVPPALADKAAAAAGETVVYDLEVVDIQIAPKTPADVAGAPANAKVSPTGTKYVGIKEGAGDLVRSFDDVTFNYTVWDAKGKMVDSSESRNRPATAPAYKMPAGLGDMLVTMRKGQRNRFWIDADKMGGPVGDAGGQLCFELEVAEVKKPANEPPPVPSDVAAAPKDAQKTAKGVWYKVLSPSKDKAAKKPVATDSVKVHYTGWNTSGKMFDTSRISGQPASFSLAGVIAGWTDGLPMMAVGDQMRFWIPEELAYKGNPAKPQGMLVFDIELLEIVQQKIPAAPAE